MTGWLEHHVTHCFFKLLFGFECPTCGMQRAFIALLRGDVAGSLHNHAAMLPLVLSCMLLCLQLKLKVENGYRIVIGAFIITFGLTLIQYIMRLMLFNR